MGIDPYEILGIKKDATLAEIKSAYRKLSKECHPDSPTGSDEIFMELNLAYRVLSDKESRILYDRDGVIMDEPTNHINNQVQSRMGDLVEKWLDNMIRGNKVPLKEFVIGGIEQGRAKVKEANSGVTKTIAELKSIKDRLTHKDGEAVIHKIIDDKIKHHEAIIARNGNELVVMEKLKEAIEEYDFESSESCEPVIITFNTGSTTAGFGGFKL